MPTCLRGAAAISGTWLRKGVPTLVRGTWKPVSGGVTEKAVASTDGDKTWNLWFDLVFRPARDGSATSDDSKTLTALDDEYQAAVRKNDVPTMDHLLADDFVLVTGSGTIYRKADLLDEARGGLVVYEHQEDKEKTVRIWGDTAVVTAKLWEKGTNQGMPFDRTVWSAIPTCALRRDGDMCLASLRCRYPALLSDGRFSAHP